MTGLHAVSDIYCENCKTTLGWKYVSSLSSDKRKVEFRSMHLSRAKSTRRASTLSSWPIWSRTMAGMRTTAVGDLFPESPFCPCTKSFPRAMHLSCLYILVGVDSRRKSSMPSYGPTRRYTPIDYGSHADSAEPNVSFASHSFLFCFESPFLSTLYFCCFDNEDFPSKLIFEQGQFDNKNMQGENSRVQEKGQSL